MHSIAKNLKDIKLSYVNWKSPSANDDISISIFNSILQQIFCCFLLLQLKAPIYKAKRRKTFILSVFCDSFSSFSYVMEFSSQTFPSTLWSYVVFLFETMANPLTLSSNFFQTTNFHQSHLRIKDVQMFTHRPL